MKPIVQKPIKQKISVPDEERVKCGGCGSKIFDMHLLKKTNIVKVSCHKCHDLVVMLAAPNKRGSKDGKDKITKQVQPKIIT